MPKEPNLASAKNDLADGAVRISRCSERRGSARREKFLAVSTFTPQELKIVRMVGLGMDDREIADVLGISRWTVHNHVQRIHEKACISSRPRLAVAAYVATEEARST